MNALRRRIRRDDSGTTMVELSVVVLILGVVMAIVFATIMIAQRTNRGVSDRVSASAVARTAMDSMSKNLRTAVLPERVATTACTGCATVSFISATPTSVQFYANNNSDQTRLGPSRMTYTLTSGTLTERMQKPDPHPPTTSVYTYCTPGASGCQFTDRVVGRDITSTALFTYYDNDGVTLTGSPLSANQLKRIDSIDVVVTVRSGSQTSTLNQRVSLPNADNVPQVTATATSTS